MKKAFQILLLFAFSIVLSSSKTEMQDEDPIRFTDCEGCPEMIVIPNGTVYIGSYEEEIGRKKGERNRVKATIEKSFALAKTEVTLGQYRVFMEETKYKSNIAYYQGEPLVGCNYFDGKSYGYAAEHNWKNPGYPQREEDPDVCVSWSDADAYAKWLSEKTGRTYRVPSTVEFEYASRAGSSSPGFGVQILKKLANMQILATVPLLKNSRHVSHFHALMAMYLPQKWGDLNQTITVCTTWLVMLGNGPMIVFKTI